MSDAKTPSFWSRLLGKPETSPPQVEEKYAPGTGISYDPQLISQLEEEHRQLVFHFTEAQQALDNDDLKKTAQHLRTFRAFLI
jgi:hypothetical protein